MSTIKVSVTAEDIANGGRCSCSRCPVALALARALPGKTAHAGPTSLQAEDEDGDRVICVSTPEEVFDFMCRFDQGDPDVQPFSFELEMP